MKLFLVGIFSFISIAANASGLKVIASYSSVSVIDDHRFVCSIYATHEVKIVRSRSALLVDTIVKPVKWTRMVTESQFQNLVDLAKKEITPIHYGERDMHGSVHTYIAGNNTLYQTQGHELILKNQSSAAEFLVNFINVNCEYGTQ